MITLKNFKSRLLFASTSASASTELLYQVTDTLNHYLF